MSTRQLERKVVRQRLGRGPKIKQSLYPARLTVAPRGSKLDTRDEAADHESDSRSRFNSLRNAASSA